MKYTAEENRRVKAAQKIACSHADKLIPPSDQSNEDYMREWSPVFDAKMRELGWELTRDHCLCLNPERAHQPMCGWSRIEQRRSR